jgi:DNA-directed RNA polymerase specialized sigma24 family protein
MSDELVSDVISSNDSEDFTEFAAARWAGLVRLAYGLTGDRWIAEDIA